MTFDTNGNLYLAEASFNRIMRIDTKGVIHFVAGNGSAKFSGDGGLATEAGFSPAGLAFDPAGNLYLADPRHSRIRKITMATGRISTAAGTGAFAFSGDGGPATAAELSYPLDIAFDAAGALYILDASNYRVRKVVDNTISTLAGRSIQDGIPATSAFIGNANGVAMDNKGNLWIADFGAGVRRVTPDGIIHKVADLDFRYIGQIAADSAGDLYYGTQDGRVVKVTPAGAVSTVPGTGVADIGAVEGLAIDQTDNLYFSENKGWTIRKVSPEVTMSVVAGSGSPHDSGDGGPATAAGMNPGALATDADGGLYLFDANAGRIRKVSDRVITTFAGYGNGYNLVNGEGDGRFAYLAFIQASSLVVDAQGIVYLTDFGSSVRRIARDGRITTIIEGSLLGQQYS